MPPEERMKVLKPEERMKAWSDHAFLIPLIAVPLAWVAGYLLYRWIIVCGGGGLWACAGGTGIRGLREPLAGLPLEADTTVRIAHDVAARFAWQPTLVAFVVVALGTMASCWYLIHRALQDSVPWYCGRRAIGMNIAIVLTALVLAMGSWSQFPIWIVHTEVLAPTLEAALGRGNPAVRTAEQIQHLFQVLAVVASVFVVGAASAALLTPIWTRSEREALDAAMSEKYTSHLADQWRRLSLTLYAAAALLVTAVVHQSAMYGWGNAFADAMTETRRLRVQEGKASRDSLESELEIARARVVLRAAELLDAGKDTLAGTRELRRNTALLAFRVDSAKQILQQDSVGGGAREGATQATMVRIGRLMSSAITRGGGLVYTILLAVTYLPAALVLMERAWELSRALPVAGTNAEERGKWRVAQGVGFSLGDQWTRIFAVLSPVLASGGAVALAEIYKVISS